MKPFSFWLAITLIVFGTFSGGYHLYLTQNPRKVMVAVDSSFPMQSVWHQVSRVLKIIGDKRYAEFSLVTEKNRIHSWSSKLKLGNVSPYAPRNFSKLVSKGNLPEIDEATETYFITNADASQTEKFGGWEIIYLTP